MRKHAFIIASVAAVTLLGLSACSGESSATDSVVGTWGQVEAPGQPSIEFSDDGRYAGTDGCNNIMGSWKVDDNTIDLGVMATTMMACEGVDEWLSKSTVAVKTGDTLTFFDQNDTELGKLDRA